MPRCRPSELAADQRNAPHRRHDRRVHQGRRARSLKTLTEARYSTRPHVLDDATVDRIDRVHTEQLEFVDIYAQQIGRWRTAETVSGSNARTRTGWTEQNRQLRDRDHRPSSPWPANCARDSIDRIMGMSDIELGLQALLGSRSAKPPLTRPTTLRAIPLPCKITPLGLPPLLGAVSNGRP